jgi:hypothetical protein
MELPLLRIGLLGFSRTDANLASAQILSAPVARSRWEVVPFEDADLWLINSSSVRMGAQTSEDHGLHIANPDAPHSPLTIYPHQTSRPVAFTEPLPANMEVVLSIELSNSYQCASRLNDFASTLPQLCNHFALGEQVASRQSNLHKGIYHLHFEGRQVATVDFEGWQVGVLPAARAIDLALASWRHRPGETAHMPQSFEVFALERLMWVYASRSKAPHLPASYQSELIYLRRLSVLPQSWLHQDHMALISLLSQQPMYLGTLSQQARLPLERLQACLAALYYSGTITTDTRQILVNDLRADQRVNSGFIELPLGQAQHGNQEHASGQSVFETHSFAPSSAHGALNSA